MDLTNSQRKLYASLATAKGRRESRMFMAQGTKCVADTLGYYRCEALLATAAWVESHREIAAVKEAIVVKSSDLQRISTLSTAPEVIAVYMIPEVSRPALDGRLTLALDCVQDPGNLGTIIRVADWMGIDTILASADTVDVWSPKVVQATMGAISRVSVCYCDLDETLSTIGTMDIYGTYLDGDNIYTCPLSSAGIIVMGNEGKGISDSVSRHVNRRITIPPYPLGQPTSESLNVAVATAITLAEFRRRMQ